MCTVSIFLIVLLFAIFFVVISEDIRQRRSLLPRAAAKTLWKGAERRKSIRLPENLQVVYTITTHPDKKKETRTKDISKEGVGIILYEKYTQGDILELKVYLPDKKKPLSIQAEVVWVKALSKKFLGAKRTFFAGCKFARISNYDQKQLTDYIHTIIATRGENIS
jgi:c-di-GMP-binding flagellar brake protein YcgR